MKKYIAEIKAFYDLVLTNQLSTGQIALWHALMHLNNKNGWKDWISAPNQTLELLTGLTRQAIVKNRNVLKQAGLIDFKLNGTKATVYMLNSLQDGLQDGLQSGLQGSLQDSLQSSCTYIDYTTLNETTHSPSVSSPVPYDRIISEYSRICTSYPRITKLSENRRKAIHARMTSGYTFEDFVRVFEKAEASSFLKGKNNRNWSANFDWMIKDANMAKILDGNYDDKETHTAISGRLDDLDEYF